MPIEGTSNQQAAGVGANHPVQHTEAQTQALGEWLQDNAENLPTASAVLGTLLYASGAVSGSTALLMSSAALYQLGQYVVDRAYEQLDMTPEQVETALEQIEARLHTTLEIAQARFNGGEPIDSVFGFPIAGQAQEIDGAGIDGQALPIEREQMNAGVGLTAGLINLESPIARDFAAVHEMGHLLQLHLQEGERVGVIPEGQQTEVMPDLISAFLMHEDGVSSAELLTALEENATEVFDLVAVHNHPAAAARIGYIRDFLELIDGGTDVYEAMRTVLGTVPTTPAE